MTTGDENVPNGYLSVLNVIECHRGDVVQRAPVSVTVERARRHIDHRIARRLRCRGSLLSTQKAAEQSATPVRSDALLLFLSSEITHDDRSKHHQNLCDLSRSETRFVTGLLHDGSLIAAENMPEDPTAVGLSRRSCFPA